MWHLTLQILSGQVKNMPYMVFVSILLFLFICLSDRTQNGPELREANYFGTLIVGLELGSLYWKITDTVHQRP